MAAMGLDAERLNEAMARLARADARLAAAIDRAGVPAPRSSPRGAATLLRAIIGQQVSMAAAATIWGRLEAACGGDVSDLAALAALDDAALRAAGLSGQKARYVRALAAAVLSGGLDLAALPVADEAAVAALTAVTGIGRWTAEIYLLFAEGRADVFPAGDLAVQVMMGRLLEVEGRPGEAATRALAQPFSPDRGALAIFCWHQYNMAS
jgi:DNA-3-methyladenine glycosylase II